jgi:hypothetical protein
MFDEDGYLLGAWYLNDAQWRGEYLNPFIRALGFKVERSEDPYYLATLEDHFR